MTVDRWPLVLAGLLGEPWPLPAPIPGRQITRPWPSPDDDVPDAELAPFAEFVATRQALADRLQAAAERRKAERKAQQLADRAGRGSTRKPARHKAGMAASAATARDTEGQTP